MTVFREEMEENMQVKDTSPALNDLELGMIRSTIEKGNNEIIENLYKEFVAGMMHHPQKFVEERLSQFVQGVLLAENVKKLAIQAIEAAVKERRNG